MGSGGGLPPLLPILPLVKRGRVCASMKSAGIQSLYVEAASHIEQKQENVPAGERSYPILGAKPSEG
jgi:hypothetical protein